MMINLAMDVVVAGLLLATIFYCWKVSRYMQEIRDGRSELAQLLEQFDKSTTQAQASITELKKTGDKIADKIQVKIEKAEFMTDDLAFMTDKANKLAEQLSQHIAAGKSLPLTRKEPEPQRVQQQAPAASVTPAKKSGSAAESAAAILDSLLSRPRPNEVATANAAAARGAAALEQIARAIPRESGAQAAVATAPMTAQPGPRPRSQAEQELLEVLKAIR